MADFTPEHYLAAARIYDKQREWRIARDVLLIRDYEITCLSDKDFILSNIFQRDACRFMPEQNYEQRWYLREALDKEYGITIRWDQDANKWVSTVNRFLDTSEPIPTMLDDDITRLMMKNVVALVEAGVVE